MKNYKISIITVTKNSEKFLGVVLEEDFHLSFPYVFKDDKNIYMVPESSQSNQRSSQKG